MKKYLAPSLNNRYHTQNVPPILCLILCINSELDMKKKIFCKRHRNFIPNYYTHIFGEKKKTVPSLMMLKMKCETGEIQINVGLISLTNMCIKTNRIFFMT